MPPHVVFPSRLALVAPLCLDKFSFTFLRDFHSNIILATRTMSCIFKLHDSALRPVEKKSDKEKKRINKEKNF